MDLPPMDGYVRVHKRRPFPRLQVKSGDEALLGAVREALRMVRQKAATPQDGLL
jgi:hypothetical protein